MWDAYMEPIFATIRHSVVYEQSLHLSHHRRQNFMSLNSFDPYCIYYSLLADQADTAKHWVGLAQVSVMSSSLGLCPANARAVAPAGPPEMHMARP